MLLTLNLNQDESQQFHSIIQWLDYEVPELADETEKQKIQLAELVYKAYRKRY